MPLRKGKATRAEALFVRKHKDSMTLEQLMVRLNRGPDTIRALIEEANTTPDPELAPLPIPLPPRHSEPDPPPSEETLATRAIKSELKRSEIWKAITAEFTKPEVKLFEEHYVRLMKQFKNDVKPSEETQIHQACRFEVLMHRNMVARKRARSDIDRLEGVVATFSSEIAAQGNGGDDRQRRHLFKLEEQLSEAKKIEQGATGEYVKLQERQGKIFESLKALRDQRLKAVESGDKDFLGVIRSLMERDAQEREGRQTALMRLAGDREHTRLGRPHTYEDGSMDSPILSCDTVDLGPEEAEPQAQQGGGDADR